MTSVHQYVCSQHGVVIEYDAPGPKDPPRFCPIRACKLPLKFATAKVEGPAFDGTVVKLDDARDRFNAAAAQRAANEGIARADDHAPDGWKAEADAAIERTAALMGELTPDDVWEFGKCPDAPNNTALGGRMRSAAARGIIEGPIRQVRTRQKKSHGAPTNVWRSLIYKKPE